MKIVLKHQISGTRNGETWPAPGSTIDLPDDEAVVLLGQGMAEPAGDEPVETADVTPRKKVPTGGASRGSSAASGA